MKLHDFSLTLIGNLLTCNLLTYDVYCCHGNREMKGCFGIFEYCVF